jgi:SAM-dependent methyltransferase
MKATFISGKHRELIPRLRAAVKPRSGAQMGAISDRAAAKVDSDVSEYWTQVNVTLHHQFTSAAESLAYLRWRNDCYFGYAELMPTAGQDGQEVLDFGCGPGHDMVGFSVMSTPKRLIGMDVSATSLAEARTRLALHGAQCELMTLAAGTDELPLEPASVDYVHASGVIHHVADPLATLRELRRVLRPTGTARVMVYNYDSVFVHLYVAYMRCLVENAFPGLKLEDAFARSTDGTDCPISRFYGPSAFLSLCDAAGFDGKFTGAAVSVFEAKMLPNRFDAILDRRLPEASRRFLLDLTFDQHGMPWYQGNRAGIDACFLLHPR